MKKIFRLLGDYFKFNLSAGMAYRGAFFLQVFSMVLNNSAFIIFWLILYSKIGGTIKGYEFSDVMFLWALVASGFGLSVVFFGNASYISRIIYSGELDVYLTQPKPVLLNVTASRMVVSGWGDIIYGIVLYVIAVKFSLISFLVFIFGSVLYALMVSAVRVLYHSFTFRFGNAEDFALTMSELSINFALYPGSIFKGAAKFFLHSLVPVAFMVYMPVSLIKNFSILTVGIIIAADALIITLSILMFYRGLKTYESGNKIGTRL